MTRGNALKEVRHFGVIVVEKIQRVTVFEQAE